MTVTVTPMRYHFPGWTVEVPRPRPTGVDHDGEEYPEFDDDGEPMAYHDDFKVWAPRPETDEHSGRSYWQATWQGADWYKGESVRGDSLDEVLVAFDDYDDPQLARRIKAAFRTAIAAADQGAGVYKT